MIPALTTTQTANIVKTIFNPKVAKLYPDKSKSVTMLFKPGTAQEVNSVGVVISDETGPNTSMGGLIEGGQLADPSSPRWARRVILYERITSAGGMTRDAHREWIKSPQSLARGFGRVLDGHMSQVRRFENLFFWSSKGEIGTAEATAGLTTSQVKFALPKGTFEFVEGMKICFADPTTLAVRANGGGTPYYMTVTTVDATNRVVTFDVVRPSDYANGDLALFPLMAGRVPVPLKTHVNNDNGSYFGGSRSANRGYKASVIAAGSVNVSIALLAQLIEAPSYVGGDEGTAGRVILGATSQVSSIKRISDTIRQWFDQINLQDLHVKNVEHAGIAIKGDEQGDPTTLYNLKPEDFELFEAEPLQVVDLGNGIFNPVPVFTAGSGATVTGGYMDQQVYYLEHKYQHFCRKPNNQAVLTGLAVRADVFTAAKAWA